jgi:hypothetical protein
MAALLAALSRKTHLRLAELCDAKITCCLNAFTRETMAMVAVALAMRYSLPDGRFILLSNVTGPSMYAGGNLVRLALGAGQRHGWAIALIMLSVV